MFFFLWENRLNVRFDFRSAGEYVQASVRDHGIVKMVPLPIFQKKWQLCNDTSMSIMGWWSVKVTKAMGYKGLNDWPVLKTTSLGQVAGFRYDLTLYATTKPRQAAAVQLRTCRSQSSWSPCQLDQFISGWWFGCHFLCSHINWVANNRKLTFIFFRGVAQPPTRYYHTTLGCNYGLIRVWTHFRVSIVAGGW